MLASAGQAQMVWTSLAPGGGGPAGRENFAMAYDSARQRVVVFGGHVAGSPNLVNDTWEWNGSSWTEMFPAVSPSARAFHAMAYDAARGEVILFGGNGVGTSGSTWAWDGDNWSVRATDGPAPRRAHAMAYDAARQQVAMHGGRRTDTSALLNDTWLWDGTTWTSAPNVPASTQAVDVLADASVDDWQPSTNHGADSVLRAGAAVSGDGFSRTYFKFDLSPWAGMSPTSATLRCYQTESVGFSCQFKDVFAVNAPWIESGITWNSQPPIDLTNVVYTCPSPSPGWLEFDVSKLVRAWTRGTRPNHGLLLRDRFEDGVNPRPVVCASREHPDTSLRPVLRLEFGTVTNPAESSHDMAYDGARERVVMVADDHTYEWDGSVWELAGFGPHVFEDVSDFDMAYDPVRRRTVLQGGASTSSLFEETWEWDGYSWRPGPDGPNRRKHSMVFDEAAGHVFWFGGDGFFTDPWSDAWTYASTTTGTTTALGPGCAGASGVPELTATGSPIAGNINFHLAIDSLQPDALAFFGLSFEGASPLTIGPCTLYPEFPWIVLPTTASGAGVAMVYLPLPFHVSGWDLYLQGGGFEPTGAFVGVAALTGGMHVSIGD